MSAADLLDHALEHHRAGRLGEALAFYGRLLAQAPDHADALHLSGLAACQSGQAERGLTRLRNALAVQPAFPEALDSLGRLLADLGRPREAEAAYRHALDIAPGSVGVWVNLGLLHRRVGRADHAAHAFHEAVKRAPGHAGAWRHLALCLRALRHPDAEACLRRALDDAAGEAELSRDLATLLTDQGRHAEACAVLEVAVPANPDDGLLRFLLGSALQAQGRLPEAVVHYREALVRRPDLAGAGNNLGVALIDLGDPAGALPALRLAVVVQPADAVALNNLGTALDGGRRLDEAAAAYTRALRLRPDYGKALNNLGGLWKAWKRSDRAGSLRRRAIAAQPDHPESYANLAAVHEDADDLAGAERLYRQALRLDPRSAAAWTGLGLVLRLRGRVAEAEAAHRQALSVDGRNAEALANLGMLLWQTRGDARTAEADLTAAIHLDPELGPARLNRGIVRLTRGALAEGWEDYRWRFRGKGYEDRPMAIPPWEGGSLAGRRLLVWREQGIGDELLFASCWPDLLRLAGHLVIECSRRLVPLFARSFPGATVHAEDMNRPPPADCHVPAGDVPRLLRGRLAGFLPQAPWLVPDPGRTAAWRARLAALGPGLKVGIGWRSQTMTADRRDAYAALERWGALFAVPGVRFITVQYGDCEAEIRAAEARFGVRIHRWSALDLKNDFEEAAALMANLDLVISPAMSAGELAGALGVPVWRFGNRDWTQLGTAIRPWFPAMRLFQPRPGEALEDTFVAMAAALNDLRAPARAKSGTDASKDRVAEAIALYRRGDAEGAERRVRAVLERAPGHAVALHLAAVLAARRGEHAEAASLFGQAGHADPHNAAAHAGRAEALHRLGRHKEADAIQRRAIAVQPGAPEHWVNRAALLRALERTAEAQRAIRRAGRLRADLTVVHDQLGHLAGRPAASAASHRRAVALEPAAGAGLSNLGNALHRLERFAEAERLLGWAVRASPELAVLRTNHGNALEALGRFAEAEASHRAAIGRQPALAEAHANLALLLQRTGRREEAQDAHRQALEADPKHAQAHYNRSLLLLEFGGLRNGWGEHEWRFGTQQFHGQQRRLAARAWRGENIAGRRLLVWREQGVGDEILFASCYGEASRRAGHLVVECDRRLVSLFARSFPAATVRAEEAEDRRDTELQIAAGSLPRLLRPDLKRFAEPTPWLVPDPARAAAWRARLAALGPGLKVGIGWRSQLLTAQRKTAYTTLAQWGALFAVPGVRFVTVEYGDCEAEIRAAEARFGVRIHRWSALDLKNDFEEAAALMAGLDLVISPAMSAGELAGALGVPVWRFGNRDWTQLGTAVRPWFPAMRLFQPRPGETLEDTLAHIADHLRAGNPAPRPPVQPHRATRRNALLPRRRTGRERPPAPSEDGDADAALERAVADHRAGRLDGASAGYERVLEHRPRDPVALHLSGLLAHQSGRPGHGEGRVAAALAVAPEYATAHISLGGIRLTSGRPAAAAAAFRRALALRPGDAAGLSNLGNALNALHEPERAEAAHRRAVRADPSLAEVQDNHGAVLARLKRPAEAEAAHRRALERAPGLVAAWMNRSVALRRLGRLDAAERAGRVALALDPAQADAMANRGRLLRERGAFDAALGWCDRAARVVPGLPAAAVNGGLLRLARGDLTAGWAGYDRRFDSLDLAAAARRPGVPVWSGDDPAKRRILVWREQGIGDELMTAGLLPDLMERAANASGHVVVECDRRLVPLYARSFPQATIRPSPDQPDALARGVDCHIAALSLARVLRRSLGEFPGVAGILRADPEAVAAWRRRVGGLGPGLAVGIAWRSGQLDPERMPDYTRLEDWGAVFAIPGIIPVNLQYGECADELAAARRRFGVAPHAFDLDLRNDLDGAAALTAALDLVIAPATSTGELAGMLGVPVWRLGRGGDWTALGAAVRPWFPSMRLFTARGGETVADRLPAVAAALLALVKKEGIKGPEGTR